MLEICFFVISKIEEHVLCGEEGEEEKDVTERISKTVNWIVNCSLEKKEKKTADE